MSFKETLKTVDTFSADIFNLKSSDIAYLLSMVNEERTERKFNKYFERYKISLEAIERVEEFENKLIEIKANYEEFNSSNVNMESIDSVIKLSNIQEQLLDLKHNFQVTNKDSYFSTNSEDLTVNIEGLITEMSNAVNQAFSDLVSDLSRSIKSIRNLFASLIGNRKRKLSALRANLNNVSKINVSKYTNDEFLSEYFAPLKLSNFDVAKTLEQIDDLQTFVNGLMNGRYPDDTGSIGVKLDKHHPDIVDRVNEIQDYVTYRNYSGMRFDNVNCLGYRYSGNILKAYLSFIFRVPKENITKFPFSLRDFKNVNYGPIKIIDGKDVIIRVNETVSVNFRNESKTIKFDKAIAIRAIDNELLRINKVSGIILKSVIEDVVKGFQSLAVGIASSFDKAVPMGVGREIDMAGTALNPFISLLKILFSGNKLTDWFMRTYVKSYSGLVEMSKMNYDMLVDYSNAIIDSAESR